MRGIPNLRGLILRNNAITCLQEDLFSDLPILAVVRLSGNQIEYLYPSLLSGLTELWELDLDRNNLQCIHADFFLPQNFEELFFNRTRLLTIRLYDNPLHCCTLDWLKELRDDPFYWDYYFHADPDSYVELTCADGLDWETLDPDNVPPCSSPVDMTCDASWNNPQCLPSPCTQTGTSFDCSSQNLNSVPNSIDPVTTQINLRHNNIGSVTQADFAGLSSAKKLDINWNNINSLGAVVFSEMLDLRVLMLRGNSIAC